MQTLRPESAAAMTAHRREAVRLAKAQEKAVSEKCQRSGQKIPGYSFDELIGKGSFGRVYKGRQMATNKVVAVKVLDVDDADFQAYGDMKDEQIRDFNREIQILRRAQDSGAVNLNQMIEALPVHSQLWLVCEYCPGGSVKTLMRATKDRLSEKYLIIVARELAKALKGLHQAGIMHRDVKAANVLIHESGGLQLCDFGIAAALEGHTDKRRTFVGTLHWMPPELWADKPEYSDEVDVWGYGCTLYECAMGTPPNSDVRERQQLKVRMRRLKQSIGLPEKEAFSEGLRSLVKFALNPDAASRPSMHDILQHEFLADTEETYPTSSLTELVQFYYGWLFSGGQRVSLFMPGGAAAASDAPDILGSTMTDEWNFSMTQDFEKRVSAILEIPDLSDLSIIESLEGEATPRAAPGENQHSPPKTMTAAQKANFELRVQRGADLSNIFDQKKPMYEYKTKHDFVPVQEPERRISDLPFRAMAEDRPTSIASVAIDLGDFDEEDYAFAAPRTGDDRIQTTYAATPMKEDIPFKLPDAATIRAKRADSKGPREGSSQPPNDRRRSSGAGVSDPTQQEWTIRESRSAPELQEAAEITPTANTSRPKERDTMGWSFADAMSEISTTSQSSRVDDTTIKKTESSLKGPDSTEKNKKHATMEWSFSMAMAEVVERKDDDSSQWTPGRHSRPAVLLRTMTQPITSHEVHEAYDDLSRPGTAMSGTYSESSASSTDFDPFALDRRAQYDEEDEGMPGEAEIDEMGASSFYATRGRTMVPPEMSGPGPGYTTGPEMANAGSHIAPYQMGRPARIGDDGFPGPTTGSNYTGQAASVDGTRVRSPRGGQSSPRQLGHIRGNGSVASGKGSGSSHGSGIGRDSRASSRGANGITASDIKIPIPAPPHMAAMAANANSEVIEKELQRLLTEFQGALSVAGEVVGEGARGRARRRQFGESGSEWEDDD